MFPFALPLLCHIMNAFFFFFFFVGDKRDPISTNQSFVVIESCFILYIYIFKIIPEKVHNLDFN